MEPNNSIEPQAFWWEIREGAVKNYNYRCYPKKSTTTKLKGTLRILCWFYNNQLAWAKDMWKTHKLSVQGFFDDHLALLKMGWGEYEKHRNHVEVTGLKRLEAIEDPEDREKALKSFHRRNQRLKEVLSKLDPKNYEEPKAFLYEVYSDLLQSVNLRLKLAFANFFRRVKQAKKGEAPGFPRFKNHKRMKSFTYRGYGKGFWLVDENPQEEKATLRLSTGSEKLEIPIVYSRSVTGEIKQCTVSYNHHRDEMYVTFTCEDVACKVYPDNPNTVGVDVGLTTFATMSDGETIPNHRFLRKKEAVIKKSSARLAEEREKLSKAVSERIVAKQQELSALDEEKEPEKYKAVLLELKKVHHERHLLQEGKKGLSYRKWRRRLSKLHKKVKNQRWDFHHQEARKLISKYGLIAFEDLQILNMVKNGNLSKSILDAAWSSFTSKTMSKAVEAGSNRRVVKVDPRNTTQVCHCCGHHHPTKLKLGDAWFVCGNPECAFFGKKQGRDANGSKNVHHRGLDLITRSVA